MQVTLADLTGLLRGRRFVALTGAGCSTESGIPDYRGEGRLRRPRSPVEYQVFRRDPLARQRYWARSLLGWERFSTARPNPAHRALATLEASGHLHGLITQNVDGLHQAAGSRRVIELHGALSKVRCLDCRATETRARLQARLRELNPSFDEHSADLAPDGDAELDSEVIACFRVATCLACGGVLKPDVVFFGENVPRPTVDAAHTLLGEGEALLVVGSSLAVFSGYRFVRAAADRRLPVGIVNLGPSRGDAHATVRLAARAGEALPDLARALCAA